jgi:hypothetical protein
MAAGDKMLDSSGNVILDSSGNEQLDDGSGNSCCCAVSCVGCANSTSCVILTIAGSTVVTGCVNGTSISILHSGYPSSWDGTYALTYTGVTAGFCYWYSWLPVSYSDQQFGQLGCSAFPETKICTDWLPIFVAIGINAGGLSSAVRWSVNNDVEAQNTSLTGAQTYSGSGYPPICTGSTVTISGSTGAGFGGGTGTITWGSSSDCAGIDGGPHLPRTRTC